MENNNDLDPLTIIKYTFKSDLDPIHNIIYTNLYYLINMYNTKSIINRILPIINNVCSEKTINIPNTHNYLVIFLLYTQILKCSHYREKTILDNLISDVKNIDVKNIESIYKYIYAYSSHYSNKTGFLEYRNKFIIGTLIYFNVLQSKLTLINDLLTNVELNILLNIDNISEIDNNIIKLIFKKKKCLDIDLDKELLNTLLGVPYPIYIKYTKTTLFINYQEIIDLKDTLLDEIINKNSVIYTPQKINSMLNNLFFLNNNTLLFNHILNIYFDTFLYTHITNENVKLIYNHIYNLKVDKNLRLSLKLKRFKEYYLDNSFITL